MSSTEIHEHPSAPREPSMLLRKAEVAALVGFSIRTIEAWVSAGKFPRPVNPAPGIDDQRSSRRWLRSEVEAWVENLRQQREERSA